MGAKGKPVDGDVWLVGAVERLAGTLRVLALPEGDGRDRRVRKAEGWLALAGAEDKGPDGRIVLPRDLRADGLRRLSALADELAEAQEGAAWLW